MVFGSPSSLWSPTGWKSIAHFDERKRSEGSTLLPTGDQTLVESMRAQSIARRKSPDPKLGEYNRIDGLNNAVQYVQIDPQGRTWLAGGGLWYLDKDRRAIPVHPHLPFMADTKVEDFAVADNHLVLALGSRGLAILDLANLSEVTPTAQLPAIANWDRPQAHEPNSTDGAVFVSQVCPPVGSCQDKQPSDEVRKKLQDAVEETTIPSFALETYTYRGKIRGFVLAGFGSPDPEALARLFIGVLRDEPLRSSLVVFLRRGPLGTRLEEIEAAAGGMH